VSRPKEATVLQTEDLFLGAFGLTRGGELAGVEVRGVNGKRMAVFRIDGPGMSDVEREYHRGPSVVDLRLLKSEVARLKNLAFEALRREESRDAGHERGHRAHQGGERAFGRPR
jgi:hypothetical protein